MGVAARSVARAVVLREVARGAGRLAAAATVGRAVLDRVVAVGVRAGAVLGALVGAFVAAVAGAFVPVGVCACPPAGVAVSRAASRRERSRRMRGILPGFEERGERRTRPPQALPRGAGVSAPDGTGTAGG